MHLLEGRFRQQFIRDGDGYRFRQWSREVRFSQEELDAFLAQRRRVWNPVVWGAYLAVGVATPVGLALAGWSGAAWVLGTIALIWMAVLLVYVDRKPHEAAQARITDAGPGELEGWNAPTWAAVVYFLILATIGADNGFNSTNSVIWRVCTASLSVASLWFAFDHGRKWWRSRRGGRAAL